MWKEGSSLVRLMRAIRQLLAHGADLIRHALHLAAVVIDAKTALSEITKPFIKLKDASLTVPRN
jgi:hypothetical protein